MPNNPIKLSIIIPMYKVAPYVERCLRSLANQDIPFEDYEIICVNDGSPDNCAEIVESLQKEIPNIILLNQENQGVSMARNNAIAIAKGSYILPIDPDDYVVPQSLAEKLHFSLQENLDILICSFTILNHVNEAIYKWSLPLDSYDSLTGINFFNLFCKGKKELQDPDRTWGILYNRKFLTENKLTYLSDVPYLEDGEFLYRVYCCAERVKHTNDTFYIRTTRRGSATNSNLFYSLKARKGFIKAAYNLLEFKDSQCKNDAQKKFINQPIAKFTLLYLHPINIIEFFFEYSTTRKLLKTGPLRKLETEGCNDFYTKLARAYNISLTYFFIFQIIERIKSGLTKRLNG